RGRSGRARRARGGSPPPGSGSGARTPPAPRWRGRVGKGPGNRTTDRWSRRDAAGWRRLACACVYRPTPGPNTSNELKGEHLEGSRRGPPAAGAGLAAEAAAGEDPVAALRGREGRAEEVTLHLIAPLIAQEEPLALELDPLGDDADAE